MEYAEKEPYRDDVRELLEAAGWRENAEGFMIAENGALWTEANEALNSGLDAPDKAWTVAFDSGVPAGVIVAAALAAGSLNVTKLLAEIEDLRKRDERLTALENAGVDNWSGYDLA